MRVVWAEGHRATVVLLEAMKRHWLVWHCRSQAAAHLDGQQAHHEAQHAVEAEGVEPQDELRVGKRGAGGGNMGGVGC